MSTSVDTEAANGAVIRPAIDRVQGGHGPAFLTDIAVLRLREGLRAQREQPIGLRSSERNPAPSRPGSQDWLNADSHIKPTTEDFSLIPSADELAIRTKEPVPSPSWQRRKVGLLLCCLLLLAGVGVLGVSRSARTGGSTDDVSANIEFRGSTAFAPPDNGELHQRIANSVKSSAGAPSLPPLASPNELPVEMKGAATSPATVPSKEQPADVHGPATRTASGALYRRSPTNSRSERKGPRPSRQHFRSWPRRKPL